MIRFSKFAKTEVASAVERRSRIFLSGLCLTALFFLGAQLRAASTAESYQIRFQHQVTNKESRAISDLTVVLALPGSCQSQYIDELKAESDCSALPQVAQDQYGQTVHVYRVPRIEPGQTLSFGYFCRARFLDLPNRFEASLGQGKSSAAVPESVRSLYTADDERIYNYHSPSIKALANQFLSRYPDAQERVRAIHYYVASNLKYSMEDNWDSAPTVLARGSGSCSEYSYLFCALCRASGLPTRFVGGSRLRKALPYEDRVGHRWSEVYLPSLGWVPFDPTLDGRSKGGLSYAGRFFQPSLITFHGGGSSNLLGNAYNSTNTKKELLQRSRIFYWR